MFEEGEYVAQEQNTKSTSLALNIRPASCARSTVSTIPTETSSHLPASLADSVDRFSQGMDEFEGIAPNTFPGQ